jgi:hypothetical protein
MQTDSREFEFAAKGPVVQRLNVLKLMRELIVSRRNLIICQGMKHEGIVRIGAVAYVDKHGFGSKIQRERTKINATAFELAVATETDHSPSGSD